MKKYKAKQTRKEIINKAADRLKQLLKTEGKNWKKGWSSTIAELQLPVKISDGKNYHGFNIINLAIEAQENGYESNLWGTANAWRKKGYYVKAKEKAHHVFFNAQIEVEDRDFGIITDSGELKDVKKKIWYFKPYPVFNASQIQDYVIEKKTEEVKVSKVDILKDVEKYVANTEAKITFGGSRAFYSPKGDFIKLPNVEDFHDTESYYGTLLHELVHWTGSDKRLKRDFSGRFGDNAYAIEELVAESGSAILSALLGISPTVRSDHAQYINGWIEQLENKPEQVLKAITKSTQAIDFLDGLQKKGEKKKVA